MMVDRVTDCATRLASVAAGNGAVDLAPLLSQLTLDIISRAMTRTIGLRLRHASMVALRQTLGNAGEWDRPALPNTIL